MQACIALPLGCMPNAFLKFSAMVAVPHGKLRARLQADLFSTRATLDLRTPCTMQDLSNAACMQLSCIQISEDTSTAASEVAQAAIAYKIAAGRHSLAQTVTFQDAVQWLLHSVTLDLAFSSDASLPSCDDSVAWAQLATTLHFHTESMAHCAAMTTAIQELVAALLARSDTAWKRWVAAADAVIQASILQAHHKFNARASSALEATLPVLVHQDAAGVLASVASVGHGIGNRGKPNTSMNWAALALAPRTPRTAAAQAVPPSPARFWLPTTVQPRTVPNSSELLSSAFNRSAPSPLQLGTDPLSARISPLISPTDPSSGFAAGAGDALGLSPCRRRASSAGSDWPMQAMAQRACQSNASAADMRNACATLAAYALCKAFEAQCSESFQARPAMASIWLAFSCRDPSEAGPPDAHIYAMWQAGVQALCAVSRG